MYPGATTEATSDKSGTGEKPGLPADADGLAVESSDVGPGRNGQRSSTGRGHPVIDSIAGIGLTIAILIGLTGVGDQRAIVNIPAAAE